MRKNMLLFVAVFVALAIAVGGYFAYKAWNKEHANAAEIESLKVDAGKLLRAFQTNENDANKTYLSRVLEVEGDVSEIGADSAHKIMLSVPDEMMEGIVVSLDKRYAENAKNIKTGMRIKVKGFCSGYLQLSGVVLNDAVLVE
jgi:hypothetical protein